MKQRNKKNYGKEKAQGSVGNHCCCISGCNGTWYVSEF